MVVSRTRALRACQACSGRVSACAGRSAASVGAAVARPKQWRSSVRHASLRAILPYGKKVRSHRELRRKLTLLLSRGPCSAASLRRLVALHSVALHSVVLHSVVLHSVALITDMGRKPFTAEARQRKQNKALEKMLPQMLLSESDGDGDGDASDKVQTLAAASADPTCRPASSHPQSTWAPQPERKYGGHGGGDRECASAVNLAARLPFTAWREQRHVQIHMAGAGIHTSAGGYGPEAVRANTHLTLPQQTTERAAAAHAGCEQDALNRVQRGVTGGPSASSAAEDPKRALVHALQNDLSRISVLLERLDELLSA